MKFSKHYQANIDLQMFSPKQDGTTFDKIKGSIAKAIAEKLGLIKTECHIDGFAEIEISAEELKVLFDRQDQNTKDLRENWEEDLRIAGEICNGIVDTSVECSKRLIRGVIEVVKEYNKN